MFNHMKSSGNNRTNVTNFKEFIMNDIVDIKTTKRFWFYF